MDFNIRRGIGYAIVAFYLLNAYVAMVITKFDVPEIFLVGLLLISFIFIVASFQDIAHR